MDHSQRGEGQGRTLSRKGFFTFGKTTRAPDASGDTCFLHARQHPKSVSPRPSASKIDFSTSVRTQNQFLHVRQHPKLVSRSPSAPKIGFPTSVSTQNWFLHVRQHPTPSTFERRGDHVKRFKDLYLKARARSWPGLWYVCRIRLSGTPLARPTRVGTPALGFGVQSSGFLYHVHKFYNKPVFVTTNPCLLDEP